MVAAPSEPKQEIAAGGGSQNYQAGRDVNVYHGAKRDGAQPLIVRATNAQIVEFDPKVSRLLAEFGDERLRLEQCKLELRSARLPLLRWLVWLLAAAIAVAVAILIVF